MAQPALLYLTPGILLPVIVVAVARRDLYNIWEGIIPNTNRFDKIDIQDL